MKKSVLLLLLTFAFSISYSQSAQDRYTVDIHGNLQYESKNRFKASLSTNIFGDKIYKDTRGNEVKYSKEFLEKIPSEEMPNFEHFLFSELIRKYQRRRNTKEEYKVDIFGNFQHKNNKGKSSSFGRDIFGDLQYSDNDFKASLKKNIFDDKIYSDNRGNEIKYSKEFLEKVSQKTANLGTANIDELLFLDLSKNIRQKKNYKEEYTVNIFGDIEYKNSEGRKISIGKNIFDEFEYKDNQGLSSTIRKDIFGNTEIKDDKGNKTTIGKDIFGNTEIKDNKGNKTTIGKDIFGNTEIKDNKGNKTTIERDIFGDLKYKINNREHASLKKNIFDEMTYKDDKGNEIKYSKEAWNAMMKQFDSDEKVFMMLVKKYFDPE